MHSRTGAAIESACFVGGHPMAGGECHGPQFARKDLFQGRPWVLTPTAATAPGTIATAQTMTELCGAVPIVMDADQHDAAVAVVSHTPQVVASLVAALLVGASDDAIALAGPGVLDVTRIAASDPRMWSSILAANATPVADQLRTFGHTLNLVIQLLHQLQRPEIEHRIRAKHELEAVLSSGVTGRMRLTAAAAIALS
jgi:prephenate dehydrogenase